MVLLIALVPAVAVFFVALFTASRVWTWVAAIFFAALGALTGNPAYAALDIAGVGLATWLALKTVDFKTPPRRPPTPTPVRAVPLPPPLQASKGVSRSTTFALAIFVVTSMYLLWMRLDAPL